MPSFASLCFLQPIQPLTTSGFVVSCTQLFSLLWDFFCDLLPSMFLHAPLRRTPNWVSKRWNIVRKLGKILNECKELRGHRKMKLNRIWPCIFFSCSSRRNHSGWSFLCVQNQRGYSLDNLMSPPNYLRCHYWQKSHLLVKAILKHKQVACLRRKMPFTIFKYLFLFQRYSSFKICKLVK